MNNLLRLRILITALSMALIFSAFLPSIAFADEGDPPATEEPTPPPDDGGEAAPAADEPAPTEPATLEESVVSEPTATDVPTEAAPSVDETVTEVPPSEGEPTETLPTESEVDPASDLLDGLPEGTDLIVINEEGEILPLASEESAEILVAGDPIWCPNGVAPKPGVGGCSPTQTSMSDLIAYYPTGFPSNGVIWVEDGTAVNAGVTIDGSGAWLGAAGYSLTIQGGWNAVAGSAALDPIDPYTYFDGPDSDWLSIINWIGPVTIKNFVFNSATYSKTTEYSTLLIETAGNILLDKVQVNNALNTYCLGFPPCIPLKAGGATLDNRSGTGIVTVTNSSFKNNDGAGLAIFSKNAVTLKNVFVYDNDNGCSSICSILTPVAATIDNTYAASAKPVTISNSEFSGNSGLASTGIYVFSNGTVTLNNTVANFNSFEGVFIKNDYLGAYPVYVNGVNDFSFNGDDGLHIESAGAIKVSNTTVNYNGGDGAHLDNSGAAGYMPVTISGFFTGIGNGGDGLKIQSRGNVTAAYLTASDNDGSGVYISNASDLPKPVVISGKNIFNNNDNYGLFIESKGAITVYNVTATDNGLAAAQRGVQISNQSANPGLQQPVTLNGVNMITNNGARGLSIQSFGLVTVNNLTALNNGISGARIENSGGNYPKAVNIKGTNILNSNGVYGLYVTSDGAITVSNITASKNGDRGAYLDNCSWNGSTCSGTFQSNVSITGYGVFEYNGKLNGAHDGDAGTSQVGLEIRSRGAITLNTISANHNYGSGAEITTDGITTVHSVTLNGTNTFNNNGDSSGIYNSGLGINADGTIKVSKLTAMDNYGFGAWLNNRVATASQQPITVSGYSYLTGNGWDGMFILSYGAVTLSNLTSLSNQTGLYLDNTAGTYPKSVLINGTNIFNNNRDYGVIVLTDGVIKLYNITASKNKEEGAYLDNDNSATAQSAVTISGYGVFEYNGKLDGEHDGAAGVKQIGLEIKSHGSITLSNISANHNYGSGAEITTAGITTVHPVTLNGTNTFNNNGDSSGIYNSGLGINAEGAIKVSKLTAMDNYSAGAWLSNRYNPAVQQSVTVSGFSVLTNNGWDGLIVFSYGAVSLSNVTSLYNAGSGAWIVNNEGAYPKGVLINGTNTFNHNTASSGLVVSSDGAITVYDITASRNKNVGAWLDNCRWSGSWPTGSCIGTAQSNITIVGYGVFEYNGKVGGTGTAGARQEGIVVLSRGAVSLANITANRNYGTGAYIYTTGVSVVHPVTLSGTNTFTGNGDNGGQAGDRESGLVIFANGNITINNLTASGNYNDGAYLDNCMFTPTIPGCSGTGNITITGFGYFVKNQTGNGLKALSHGSITLNRVVASFNGNGTEDSGLYLEADGNVTLVCSSAFGNSWWNIYAHTPGTLTLKGVMSFGGGAADDLSYATLISSTCP